MQGWLPVRLLPGARPESSGSLSVGWMEFGETPLAEAFFEETRAKLAAAGARELETGVDGLFRLSSLLPPVRPVGLICHISRCGSTLLANALRTARDTVVVSEDMVTARLVQPFRPTPSPHLDRLWNDTRRQIAEAVFRFFATWRTGDPAQLILKLPSFATVSLPLLRQWWPEVPCVIVIRDPEEVIVANLGSGWGHGPNRAGIAEVFGIEAELDGVSPEAVCAQMLNSMLTSAIEALGPGCYVVDYEDLKARVPAIARVFGVELQTDQSLSTVMNTYSKGRGTGRSFAGDRRAKLEKITPAVRSAAQRWARGPYAELRASAHTF
jgi:hypothetical protein